MKYIILNCACIFSMVLFAIHVRGFFPLLLRFSNLKLCLELRRSSFGGRRERNSFLLLLWKSQGEILAFKITIVPIFFPLDTCFVFGQPQNCACIFKLYLISCKQNQHHITSIYNLFKHYWRINLICLFYQVIGIETTPLEFNYHCIICLFIELTNLCSQPTQFFFDILLML